MSHTLTFHASLLVLACTAAACGYKEDPVLPAARAPEIQHVAEPVVSGAFIVEPRTFKPFKITLAPGMTNARLEGTFTASGARNDIEVTLLHEAQFVNWQGRQKFEAAYVSGRVTSGTIAVSLPAGPGTYFVVFSNRFSLISNKAVVADVQLRYERES